MAELYANFAFDMDTLDLGRLFRATYSTDFWDNEFFSIDGDIYADSLDYYYEIFGVEGWTELYSDFIGYSDVTGEMYAGSVDAIYQHIGFGFDYEEWWGAHGFSISAASLQNAMHTYSTADDYVLVAAAFAGDDSFYLSEDADLARGYGGDDHLDGSDGDDQLFGGDGGDWLSGDGGDDTLVGEAGNDTLLGLAGVDWLEGGTGDDTYLADGSDTVVERPGEGTDMVTAEITHKLAVNIENLVLTGKDDIDGRGNELANTLIGNAGDNVLKGLAGRDKLDVSEGGDDRLVGGKGNDEFIFSTKRSSGDTIADFGSVRGNNDKIVIDASHFRGGLRQGKLDRDHFQIGDDHQAEDRHVRFIFDTSDKTLWFDKNGDKHGGFTLVADLQANASMTHHDILLI
ncbi:Alkaline phosphatase [Rubellimicrobium mesophilum DSM 19309]|uniref:Alkaline phosphatase n=1 Tax=Rubellimicrobium mesophilum DSM 19309 TaxID=442562 RepID=A0A017HJH2_9RHOB|nr:hypothetical protein [Rubellimicrobium mesophilum]EYD74491.1 Alkaline phosphatase [Rubellimicrobium mesophilum DSM 19309]